MPAIVLTKRITSSNRTVVTSENCLISQNPKMAYIFSPPLILSKSISVSNIIFETILQPAWPNPRMSNFVILYMASSMISVSFVSSGESNLFYYCPLRINIGFSDISLIFCIIRSMGSRISNCMSLLKNMIDMMRREPRKRVLTRSRIAWSFVLRLCEIVSLAS